MATRRRTSASTGKSKKSGMARTFILIAVTVIVLAAVALIITYFYIKSDRKTAPEISEINVKTPILKQVKPTEVMDNEPIATEQQEKPALKTEVLFQKFEGTWVSTANGSMLNLKDESFLIDFPSVEKKVPLKGHFVVKGNSITFIASNDDQSCGVEPGQYTFTFKDKDLILSKVQDKCSKRASMLEARWFKL